MQLTTINGTAVHPVGIGTWNIAGRYDEALTDGPYRNVEAVMGNEESEIAAIRYSVDLGQNHIDCAELYGAFHTDEVVGEALDGTDRTGLYIADKLWKHSVSPGAVRPTVEKMLSKLSTDYLDLLYIHAPWDDVDWTAAIPQIDELIDEGMVRDFGVSNFAVRQMDQARSLASHAIRANQMNFNCLYTDEVDEQFRTYCRHHNIAIVSYQPLKRQAVLHHPVLNDIAQSHNATASQVALAWLIQLGTFPIPKALKRAHIDENIAAADLRLTEAELSVIAGIQG